MKTRRWLFIAGIAMIHLVFFFLKPGTDSLAAEERQEYVNTAINLANEGIIYSGDVESSLQIEYYTRRAPAYPLLLLAAKYSENDGRILFLMQAILSLLSLLIIYKIFIENKSSYIPLIVFILFSPLQFLYANLNLPVISLQFFLMLAFYCLWSFLRGKHRRYLWLYQFLLIIAILIEPLVSFFIVPNIIFFLLRYWKKKKRLSFISSLIPLVFIIIYAGYNQQRTGYLHISSIHQENKIITSSRFLAEKDSTLSYDDIKQDLYQKCDSYSSLKEKSECINRTFIEVVQENKIPFLWFEIKNILHSLTQQGTEEWMIIKDVKETPLLVKVFYYLLLLITMVKLTGTLFYLMNKSVKVSTRLAIFFLAGTIILLFGSLGNSYYLIPISLLLAGSSAYQYGYWIGRIRK